MGRAILVFSTLLAVVLGTDRFGMIHGSSRFGVFYATCTGPAQATHSPMLRDHSIGVGSIQRGAVVASAMCCSQIAEANKHDAQSSSDMSVAQLIYSSACLVF